MRWLRLAGVGQWCRQVTLLINCVSMKVIFVRLHGPTRKLFTNACHLSNSNTSVNQGIAWSRAERVSSFHSFKQQ